MSRTRHDASAAPWLRPVTDPSTIRNVAVVGNTASGKTTLVTKLLEATTSPASEPTTADHDDTVSPPSVKTTCTPLHIDGVKINLIDTPGSADFVGELRGGLHTADAALFVVSAANGIDLWTQRLWEKCAAMNMPRAVVVNRLDHPQADFDETVALCQRMFAETVLPLYLPLWGDDGDRVAGLIGLLSDRILDYSAGYPPRSRDPESVHLDAVAEARKTLVEGILAESDDENLMDRYVTGEPIDARTLICELETAVARSTFHPVVPIDSLTGVGIDTVLEIIGGAFPSPVEGHPPTATSLDGEAAEPLTCSPSGRLAAQIMTAANTPGRFLLRVFSGTVLPGHRVLVGGQGRPASGEQQHIDRLYSPHGGEAHEIDFCVAGDICTVTRLEARPGDTVSSADAPLSTQAWSLPSPQLPIAVVFPDGIDAHAALDRLTGVDPTVQWANDTETGQTVLWCMGEEHATTVLQRIRAHEIPVETRPFRVRHRETFLKTATGSGKHFDHNEHHICTITVEPLPPGTGFRFVDHRDDRALPSQAVESIEQGIKTGMARGVTTKYPLIDVQVALTGMETGSHEPSDAALQAAAVRALADAAKNAGTRLLEPVDHVTITVAPGYARTVVTDLENRRGRILGTEPDDDHTVIRAEVPVRELLRYAVELRAMTAGSGSFRRRFARYEPTA